MAASNSLNPAKGRDFQDAAAKILGDFFHVGFRLEHRVPIGHPPKQHKFDLVSDDGRYVGESKNFSWTEGGNVPSAKLAFLNEAVFYLQHLPADVCRFVVMRRDVRLNGESLAEYYFRINRHLLSGVLVIEVDRSTNEVSVLGTDEKTNCHR